ncbi:hypothetical protein DES39_0088 [Orbus hercynius]|uniref:Uncharacterized protein n=2 Tax=Orbus hercynius TaxID=593135 RepID=A0A495RHZ4_9GAMM|nr:hypothetical protein DES39_0088 [Orbus hercynius]
MKIFMIIFMIMVVIVELLILVGCSLTVKYQVEMTTDTSEMLGAVYSMLDTLSLIIIFNLLYLGVMYILYFKKTKRG